MSFPSEKSLEERVVQVRAASPASVELVDAILVYCATLWFEPDKGGPLIEEALEVSESIGYRLGRAQSQVALALQLYIQTKYSEGLPIMSQALPVIVEHGAMRAYAWSMLLLAATGQISGDYDQALEYAFKALDAGEKSESEELVAWMHYRIADIYRELGDKQQMLEYASGCHESFEDLYTRSGYHQHLIGTGRARTQLAAAHEQLGNFDEALKFNEAALDRYQEADDRLGETRAITDIGRIYALRGDHDRGEKYLKEGLSIRQELGHRVSQTSNLLALGDLYLDRGDMGRAVEVLEEASSIAEEGQVKMRAYQIHEALSRVFDKMGDTEQAFTHFREFHRLKDEAAGEAMSLKIRNRKFIAEIDRAERDAAAEREKNEELKAKNEELARLLAELKATQDRLIQSEKMASLGQLTAGIAHEIRNPLNFVNNFSALSTELVSEMNEVLSRCSGSLPQTEHEEMVESLEMLVFNTSKITEHGARADSIVKSMLEHSRTGSGERSEVNLNKMLEEYVNLAYHGMRARETEFNVSIDRDYDEAVGWIEVVPQDLGRVFLNLLSNAFDSLREHAESVGLERANPTVGVSTSLIESPEFVGVEIRISDNGPGIPDEVQSKIFEPFFTTKPTGSGTGLGLSMSYDIVTKGHNGSLDVESIAGEGATFTVRIPR